MGGNFLYRGPSDSLGEDAHYGLSLAGNLVEALLRNNLQPLRNFVRTCCKEEDDGSPEFPWFGGWDCPSPLLSSPWIYPGEGIDPQIASG